MVRRHRDDQWADNVKAEVERARLKHPLMPTLHHAMSVIREEYLELEEELYRQKPDRCKLFLEATHLAATVQRLAVELLWNEEYRL